MPPDGSKRYDIAFPPAKWREGPRRGFFLHESLLLQQSTQRPTSSGAVKRAIFPDWRIGIAVGGLRLPGLLENALIPENAAPVHPMGAELPDLRALYNIMFRYLTTDWPDCEAFCHRLMLALLDRALTITGSLSLRMPSNPEPGSLARQVQEYIDHHFREPLTLQELGEALHASPYYLSHVFKESSGYSPMQYLTRRRIGEAQNLLVETDLPISRIAEEVGYDTQNYFNLQFSKHVGMPPRKFRQSLHGTPEREE